MWKVGLSFEYFLGYFLYVINKLYLHKMNQIYSIASKLNLHIIICVVKNFTVLFGRLFRSVIILHMYVCTDVIKLFIMRL